MFLEDLLITQTKRNQLKREHSQLPSPTHNSWSMDIRKFFGTGSTSVTNIVVSGKFTPLGRSQIRSQRGRSPPPRATRGRKCAVEPPADKPRLVHGLVRGGRKNPAGTFWINKKGVVARTGSNGMNKFKGIGSRDYCPTASFIGWDGSCLKMQCGCDSGESAAATIIQKYARRMIVLNTIEIPDDPTGECHPCGVAYSSEEETESEEESEDEEEMVFQETYGIRFRDVNRFFSSGDQSPDEEWDEDPLVRETYGRHTYNFGDTKVGPIFRSLSVFVEPDYGDDESSEIDYP